MRTLHLLLILIQCMQCYTDFTNEQVKSIMLEYMLLCGPRYVCNPEKFDSAIVSMLGNIQYKSTCPECKCDDECMSRGDCCPDVVLLLPPLTCTDVKLLSSQLPMPFHRWPRRGKQDENPMFYFIVNSCPRYNTNETLNSLCQKKYSVKERLLDPVVSSSEFPVSFRNKFCAMCNGFDNITNWLLDLDCQTFADFNFLSSYDSIIEQARRSQCTVKFTPGKKNAKPCKIKTSNEKIGHCNETGNLIEVNKDIQKACETPILSRSYGIYKNVFCYMCNPSHSLDSVISSCNSTGEWQPYHAGLERACVEYGVSEVTKPFKNIFCYICNKNNVNEDFNYLDASASIKIWYSSRARKITKTALQIKVYKLNTKYYAKRIHRSSLFTKTYGSIVTFIKEANPFEEDGLFYPTDHTVDLTQQGHVREGVNLTELIRHVVATNPENEVCRKDLVQPQYLVYPNYLAPCQCDASCWFELKPHYSKCCIDTVLTSSVSCVDETDVFRFISSKGDTFRGPSSGTLTRRSRSIKPGKPSSRRQRKRKRNRGKHRRTSNRRLNRPREKRSKYFITNGCWGNKGHPYPRDRCNRHVVDNIFSLLPLTDIITKVQYLSFDCFLCNLRRWGTQAMTTLSDNILNDGYYKVWDISVSCQGLVNFDHFLLLYDILRFVKVLNCTGKTFPTLKDVILDKNGHKESIRLPRTYCTKTPNVGQKCNETGNWIERDPNILWACEKTSKFGLRRYGRFKNVFCFLCNPQKALNNQAIITECNTTGIWNTYDINIERACAMFPLVPSHYPFKNWFCQACNENFFDVKTEGVLPMPAGGHHGAKAIIPPTFHKVTFRSLFSLEVYEEDKQRVPYCDNGTFIGTEQKPCRPVLCFPGRILKKDKCIPLLPFTNNLRYSMAFKLTVKEKNLQDQHSVLELTEQLEPAFKTFYQNLLKVELLQVEQLHMLANMPCPVEIRDGLALLVHITIFVQGYIHRELSEHTLSSIKLNLLTVKLKTSHVKFHVHESLEAIHVKTILQNVDYGSSCFIDINQKKEFLPNQDYRSIFVTPVLLCRQVELENDEYNIDWTNMSATILHLNRTLMFTEFHLLDGGKMRVCITDVKKALLEFTEDSKVEDNYLQNILEEITFLCTMISLCCLFVTFITYCLFSKLRSIPGINNMNLIVALFCAQLCLQFGVQVSNDSSFCIAIGIITHIFWLAVFSCMTICSFHMYYVFAGSGSVSATRHTVSIKSKRLWKYFSFSFIVPAIIVSINVVITFVIDGTRPAYGEKLCFISNRISYVVVFLLPIVAACCSNIYFFITTISRMKNSSQNLGLNQERKNQFVIYIKLFIITGISWLLVIVDSFFGLSALSFIAAFVNGLQGLFIFMSYICNKRIVDMYRKILCRTRDRSSQKSSNVKTVSTDAVCNTIADSHTDTSNESANNETTGKYDCDSVYAIACDVTACAANVASITNATNVTNVTDDVIINLPHTSGATSDGHTESPYTDNSDLNDANSDARKNSELDMDFHTIVYNKMEEEDPPMDLQKVLSENGGNEAASGTPTNRQL